MSTIRTSHAPGQCPLAGVVGHAGRVGTGGASDDLAAGPLGPDGELVGGGGPEGVAGAEQDRVPLVPEPLGQLGDRGGLPRAVDAGDQVDGRLLAGDGSVPGRGSSSSPSALP